MECLKELARALRAIPYKDIVVVREVTAPLIPMPLVPCSCTVALPIFGRPYSVGGRPSASGRHAIRKAVHDSRTMTNFSVQSLKRGVRSGMPPMGKRIAVVRYRFIAARFHYLCSFSRAHPLQLFYYFTSLLTGCFLGRVQLIRDTSLPLARGTACNTFR